MRMLPERLRQTRMFTKLFVFAVFMIVTVSITITWTTIKMSERFFIEKFSIVNSRVIAQMKEHFEGYSNEIAVASQNLLLSRTIREGLTEKQNNLQKMSSYFNMSQQLKRVRSNLDNYDMSIFVMGKNGIGHTTERIYWPISDEELITSPITQKTYAEPKKLMYQLDTRKDDDGKMNHYIVASLALMDRISGDIYGTMYFALNEKEFRKSYVPYTTKGSNVFIVDKKGEVLSSNMPSLIGKRDARVLNYVKKIENSKDGYIVENFMGKEQIILMQYLPSYDMYLFNILDKKAAVEDVIDKRAIVLICLGIFLAALIIVFLGTKEMTNSLTKLVRQISSAPKHGFHQPIEVNGTYETKQLGEAFNSMFDELHRYVDELVDAQKQRRTAELAALQQQINPHFLYNTLTSIKFMVRQGNVEESEITLNSFISLLQNTIGNVSETISVREEMENLKHYVLINQKRYGERIKVNYLISPDCQEYKIPKLILQPFIENSFFHAFNQKPGGYVHVMVWKENEDLICEVLDDGDGMEDSSAGRLPQTKRKHQLFSGIGVKNVHERIQLIYGEEYGVTVSSEAGEGTRIRISMPAA
ncbi:cache domain-containing sensor histidine kinase [Peribacillus kribbensis]|uniref:cache domain-containing sensor histidine kinase n=1 Tax=Peribacillus kribbensis TaxID=356658 RepID=UPI0003F6AEAC|nr:sensor histidine kinase [Peribacillus kribbensis]